MIKLDFFTPFEGHNTAEFTMLPRGDGTILTWLMSGPAPFTAMALTAPFVSAENAVALPLAPIAATLARAAPPALPKAPPTYTLPPDTARAFTAPSVPGFQLVALPLPSMAARLARPLPPALVNWPPT